MDKLSERVERAVWPQRDRVLNREIALAVGWVRKSPSEAGRKNPAWFHPSDCRDGHVVMDSLHGTDVWREPLDYLGSLDAAMTLVPDAEWPWNVTMATAYGSASVIPADGKSTGIHDPRCGHARGCQSPAIALCAAALKARGL